MAIHFLDGVQQVADYVSPHDAAVKTFHLITEDINSVEALIRRALDASEEGVFPFFMYPCINLKDFNVLVSRRPLLGS